MNKPFTQKIEHESGKIGTAYFTAAQEAREAIYGRGQPEHEHPMAHMDMWIRHIEYTVFTWEAETLADEALRNGVGSRNPSVVNLIPMTDRGHIPMNGFTVTTPLPADPATYNSAILRAAREQMPDGWSVLTLHYTDLNGGTLKAGVSVAQPSERPDAWLAFGYV